MLCWHKNEISTTTSISRGCDEAESHKHDENQALYEGLGFIAESQRVKQWEGKIPSQALLDMVLEAAKEGAMLKQQGKL